MNDITQQLEEIQKQYDEKIQIVPGFHWSQKDTIEMVEFYSNSRYMHNANSDRHTNEGLNTDEYGRDLPFYNVVNAAVDVSVVATDIDRKDVTVKAEDPQHSDQAFIMEKEIDDWMQKSGFDKTLNKIGETRARYGGVLVKKVVKDGELCIEVPEWKNLITDPIDIEDGHKVEIHYMTPTQLSRKKDAWDNVEDAIDLARKETEESPRNQVTVYEIHGEFPETVDPDIGSDGDENTYKRMKFFVAGDEGQTKVILFHEDEKEDPYKYKAWKPVSGRALGRGVVEEGEEAQVWTNDAIQREKDAMELGSKTIYFTDSNTIEDNVMVGMDNGHIIQGDQGDQFAQVSTTPAALGEFQNLIDKWFNQYQQTTATHAAQRGETLPANTPFALGQMLQEQSGSHFEYRREEAGSLIEDIMNDWVIPHLRKKINREHILRAELSASELKRLDQNFRRNRANNIIIDRILDEDTTVTPDQYEQLKQNQDILLQSQGPVRFLEVPKDYLKDVTLNVKVNTTGEQQDKSAIMQSLSSIFQIVASNPEAVRTDPNLQTLFSRIVEISGSGISPMELDITSDESIKRVAEQANEAQQTTTTTRGQGAVQRPQGAAQGSLAGARGG